MGKPIVMQAMLPLRYQTYDEGKPISAKEIRFRVAKFLRANLTEDLARRRDAFVSQDHRLQFQAPFDFNDPTFRKSVRIESELDAWLSEYAGIMQIPKRHVVWLAVALPDSQHPAVLQLKDVLRQEGVVQPSWFTLIGGGVRQPY